MSEFNSVFTLCALIGMALPLGVCIALIVYFGEPRWLGQALSLVMTILVSVFIGAYSAAQPSGWGFLMPTALAVLMWSFLAWLVPSKRPAFIEQKTMACKACGYDLRGNRSGACPECGAVIEKGEESGGKAEKGV